MNNELLIHLITASVSPAVMISGTALLVLAFLGRQGLLTGRLREMHELALHHAELFQKEGGSQHASRAALSLQQVKGVFAATHTVKWTLIFLFLAIIEFVLASISLGASVFFQEALLVAVIFFVLGVVSLLVATLSAMNGAIKSLGPLKQQQAETEKLLEEIGGMVVGRKKSRR